MLSNNSICIVALLFASLFGTFAHAREMRALVVGVSEYPNLPREFQLEGPRNDAARARCIDTTRIPTGKY
jgi:hypothetical protein